MTTAERVDRSPGIAIMSATQEGLGKDAQGVLDKKLLQLAAALVGVSWSEGSEIVKRGWLVPNDATFERTKGYWLGKYDGSGIAVGPIDVEQALALAVEFGQDAFLFEGALYEVKDGKIVRITYAEATIYGLDCVRLDGYTMFEDGSTLGYIYPAVQELGTEPVPPPRNEFDGDALQCAMGRPMPRYTSGLATSATGEMVSPFINSNKDEAHADS